MQVVNSATGCWAPSRVSTGQHRRTPARAAAPAREFCRAASGAASLLQWHLARQRAAVQVRAAATGIAMPELPALDGSYEDTCRLTPYSNWLMPGHVMLGRYPFVEPDRCKSVEQGEVMLRRILEAGITTFVCLQDELPPQSEMRVGGMNGYLPYRATATLLASALSDPPSLEEVGALRTPQLDKFLPPRRGGGVSLSDQRRRIELDFVHSPIVDLSVPNDERLTGLLEELAARLQRGERLYVHCWGGRGRAGMVGACLLAKVYGMGADEALARVGRAYATRLDGSYRSPQTDEQVQYVRDFIGRM